MTTIQKLLLVAALGIASACRTEEPPDTKGVVPPHTSDAAPTGIGAHHNEMLTGALSEEEFKALHHPATNVAPPRRGEMIEIAGSHAYLSLPAGAKAPMPGVVVIHEWWGLNENIMYWADRLAAEGYAAIAVDLYGGVVATTPDQAMAAMKAVTTARATEILLAAHGFLKDDERVRAPRRASIGWCFGGGQSLQLALAAPDLDAAVVYYGNPVTNPEELAPMHAKLLGIFGTRDKSIPPEKVAEFESALRAAGKDFVLKSYDAEHAFANPSSARYDEGSAAEAWREVRAFLKQNLASNP